MSAALGALAAYGAAVALALSVAAFALR